MGRRRGDRNMGCCPDGLYNFLGFLSERRAALVGGSSSSCEPLTIRKYTAPRRSGVVTLSYTAVRLASGLLVAGV